MKNKSLLMCEKILLFIADSPTGRSSSEISRFIWSHNNPTLDVNAKRKATRWLRDSNFKVVDVPIWKDYWSTNLYGNYSRVGLLKSFCLKSGNKYFLAEPIKGPFLRTPSSMMTTTYYQNLAYYSAITQQRLKSVIKMHQDSLILEYIWLTR